MELSDEVLITVARKIRKLETSNALLITEFLFKNEKKIENKAAAKVSIWVVHLLALQEKPFINGELIKLFLIHQLQKSVQSKLA